MLYEVPHVPLPGSAWIGEGRVGWERPQCASGFVLLPVVVTARPQMPLYPCHWDQPKCMTATQFPSRGTACSVATYSLLQFPLGLLLALEGCMKVSSGRMGGGGQPLCFSFLECSCHTSYSVLQYMLNTQAGILRVTESMWQPDSSSP